MVTETSISRPSLRRRTVSKCSTRSPLRMRANMPAVSWRRSSGTMVAKGAPIISWAVKPKIVSAPLFQSVTMPSSVLPMMASSDEFTIAANRLSDCGSVPGIIRPAITPCTSRPSFCPARSHSAVPQARSRKAISCSGPGWAKPSRVLNRMGRVSSLASASRLSTARLRVAAPSRAAAFGDRAICPSRARQRHRPMPAARIAGVSVRSSAAMKSHIVDCNTLKPIE